MVTRRKTLAEGRHLGLYEENGWEYAARPGVSGVVGSECIIVHEVPRRDLQAWLADREENGILIDFKIMASVWLAEGRGLI